MSKGNFFIKHFILLDQICFKIMEIKKNQGQNGRDKVSRHKILQYLNYYDTKTILDNAFEVIRGYCPQF
jgi:hypothetical protein